MQLFLQLPAPSEVLDEFAVVVLPLSERAGERADVQPRAMLVDRQSKTPRRDAQRRGAQASAAPLHASLDRHA